MIKKVIRLEYDFGAGKKTISFKTTACTNEACASQIKKILSQLQLTKKKISKIELLEILE